MTYLLVLIGYLAVLFVVAWLGRRSMGVPTLVLASGALLADLWTSSLTPIVAGAGVELSRPPLTSVVAITLTLLPAFIVMFRSQKVSSSIRRVSGSAVFAVLGVLLTYGAFSSAVVLDAASQSYVLEILKYQNVVITLCVALAILMILFQKEARRSRRS
ncbi:MAG: hypothetical protein ABI397_00270 [Candidatus Saccharimonas sp.]